MGVYLKRIMKFYIVLSCMILLASTASATLIAVTGLSAATTASLTGTAAILLGAKLLALKGLLIGRALRGRREVETLSEVFLEASKKDQYDCAKMLVCELNSRPEYTLEEDEMIIAKTFGQMEAIDLSLTSVEFDRSYGWISKMPDSLFQMYNHTSRNHVRYSKISFEEKLKILVISSIKENGTGKIKLQCFFHE